MNISVILFGRHLLYVQMMIRDFLHRIRFMFVITVKLTYGHEFMFQDSSFDIPNHVFDYNQMSFLLKRQFLFKSYQSLTDENMHKLLHKMSRRKI